jgi:hypothetical protein
MFIKKEKWDELNQRLIIAQRELDNFKDKTKLKLKPFDEIYQEKLNKHKNWINQYWKPDKTKIEIYLYDKNDPLIVEYDDLQLAKDDFVKMNNLINSERNSIRIGNSLINRKEIKVINLTEAKNPNPYTEEEIENIAKNETNKEIHDIVVYCYDEPKYIKGLLGNGKWIKDELWNK